MNDLSPINFVTDVVTFSYVKVFAPEMNPSGVLKYSATLILPKSNTKEKARWDACIEAAIKAGIAKGKFTANQKPILKLPIRDGDAELKVEKRKGDEWKNSWFINVNSDNPPGITKPQGGQAVAIIDPLEFYSGCKGRAIVSFFPFKNGGSMGVAVGLNGCYKVADGERLDGRVNAASVFSQFAEQDSEADENTGTFE
jgi:hypothetical protein